MVDSKQQKLNSFEIVHAAIEYHNNTSAPVAAQLTGIMAELSMPNTEVKQFGNTLFVTHLAPKRQAVARAFNGDVITNLTENLNNFITYAYKNLGIDTLIIPSISDPIFAKLIKKIFAQPIRPDMNYQVNRLPNGRDIAVAKLGPTRD